MSKHYIVTWTIDIYADTPEAAVKQAQEHIQREDTWATVFDVKAADNSQILRIDTMNQNTFKMPHDDNND